MIGERGCDDGRGLGGWNGNYSDGFDMSYAILDGRDRTRAPKQTHRSWVYENKRLYIGTK